MSPIAAVAEGFLEFCRDIKIIDRWMERGYLGYRQWKFKKDQADLAEALETAKKLRDTGALAKLIGREL